MLVVRVFLALVCIMLVAIEAKLFIFKSKINYFVSRGLVGALVVFVTCLHFILMK